VKNSGSGLVVLVLSLFCLVILHVQLSVSEGVQAATPTLRPAPPISTAHPTTPYAQAAQALRENNLQMARQELESVARRHPEEAVRARLLAGLYAQETGDATEAGRLLAAMTTAGDRLGGELEDWRLWLIAESAKRQRHGEEARAALDRLLASCPRSPLRPAAYLEAARLADAAGDERRTLALIDGGRREKIGGSASVELENLAWKIGQRLNDPEVRREAARHLLVEAPLTASALNVTASFRAIDGKLDWSRVLSSGEVKERARSFLGSEQRDAALTTLDKMPETERDIEWHLIKARALTESRRGQDALQVLAAVAPRNPGERATLEWERAVAAAAAARSRQTPERREMLEDSHRHLAAMVKLGVDPQVSGKQLAQLYRDFLAAGLFQPAVDTLRLLHRLDPADTTGARDLWERGWNSYQHTDFATAATVWHELAGLYPGQADAQRGLYWEARALERLGRKEEAHARYRDLVAAADTDDFYGRQAAERLGGGQPVSAAIELARASSPWPSDPLLRRAKLLTDVGLDKLALRELDLVAAKANPRDLLALRALVMGRQGNRRGSIALLREAFPALGGPRQSTVPEEILRAYYPIEYAGTIRDAARSNGVPAALVAGVIRQESAFDPRATSRVGARGLMQLMPATAREMTSRLGLRAPAAGLYDPRYSIQLGSAYLRDLLHGFNGNVELALGGYNGGPNRIRRLWQQAGPGAELDAFVETLNLDESRDYIKRILVLADSYRQLYPEIG